MTPIFKLVFLTVVGFTLVCIGFATFLSTLAEIPEPTVVALFNIGQMGAGAIFGLLSGKAL